jgi:hypothetical protein
LRGSTTLDVDVSLDQGRFFVTYDKMLASPAVKEIRLRIAGLRDRAPFVTETFPRDPLGFLLKNRMPDPADATNGRFDASAEVIPLLAWLVSVYDDITGFRVELNAVLEDGRQIVLEKVESLAEVR